MVILADDLTGAVDTGAFPVSCGKEVKVYVNWRTLSPDLGESEVVSVNMGSRTASGEEARRLHTEIGRILKNYKGHIIKKMDMGFRGNVAAEIEGLLSGLGAPVCFLLPSLPDFNTFTLYANQYVKGCILPKSLYAEDPIHKPDIAFIPEILGRASSLPVETVNIDEVKGENLLRTAKEKIDAGAKILVLDSVSNEDCDKIVAVLSEAYPTALWAGTLGLLRAASVRLFGPLSPPTYKKRDIKSACFSASKYETSMEQVRHAQGLGLQVITLDVDGVLAGKGEEILDQTLSSCVEANKKGDFMVITRLSPEKEFPGASEFILETLLECADRVCRAVAFDRLVIIGGETAGGLFGRFETTALLLNQKPETGIAAGILLNGRYAGKEFAAKGGSVGTLYALQKMLCKYED